MSERPGGRRYGPEWASFRWRRASSCFVGLLLLAAAFALGRLSALPDSSLAAPPIIQQVFTTPVTLARDPAPSPDPRELIPLPSPTDPGQPQEGPSQEGQAQCPLYFFEDGQFFELRPEESGPRGPFGQGNPELFPLDPVPPAPSPRPAPRPEPEPGRPPFFRAPGVAQLPLQSPHLVASNPSGSSSPVSIRGR